MKIKIFHIVMALFIVAGFALLWWQLGFWATLGMFLIVVGASVRFA